MKHAFPHNNNNAGNVDGTVNNTPGGGGVINSLFNGFANLQNKNDNEVDITDSQKGFLNELENFML